MANIPLRDYCREIENMVDKGHTDEAIAHCRHILKHFPKHINTYRLLGKAFLESRQLGDAADIFQRVLSSIPDDFVSHIGMSIIREDEGNLDAAIWHMERAFEVQSSNVAIQDELRRLYGNRDGQEPPKIRLTRGALAHMYANGHLYSQAIAEIRAVLTTDSKRLDLQALLAKMYYADKQPANAAKTASQLISKLPFCLLANQVLVDILNNSQRASEAETYRERIQELDPYYKHISPQYPTLDAIPSGVIVIEALDWEATKGGLTSQPSWATSIGVDFSDTPAGDELPEWLAPSPSALQGESDAAFGDFFFDDNQASLASNDADDDLDLESTQIKDSSFGNIYAEETTMQEEDNDNIPDWMRDAGWSSRDPNKPEEPPPPLFDDEEEKNEEGEIAKASIPDWLQAMAPDDLPEQDEPGTDSDLPDWLQEPGISETTPSQPSKSEPGISDQIDDTDEVLSETSSDDLPDWLKEIGGAPTSSVSDEGLDVPDWLGDLGDAAPEPDISSDDVEKSTVPEWLQEMSDEVASSTVSTPKEEQDTTGDLFEEKTGVDSGEPVVEDLLSDVQGEQAPSDVDWLAEMDEGQDSVHSGVTDWLSSMEQEEIEKADSLTSADIPDWLQDLGQEIPGTGELFQIEEPETPSEPDQLPPSLITEDLGEEADTDLELEDDAMAWLESLAAKQGAKEEELLLKPEDREETSPPSWLEEITTEETPETIAETTDKEEMVPEWLHETAEEPESAIEMPEEPSEDLEWSEEVSVMEDELIEPALSEEPEIAEMDEIEDVTGIPDMGEDEAMAWLEGLAAKQGAKEEELLTAPTERSEDIPDWLQGILEEEPEMDEGISAPVQEADLADLMEEEFEIEEMEQDVSLESDQEIAPAVEGLEDTPVPEEPIETEEELSLDEDAALAWLESLAAKQGVDEEELLTDVDARPEDTPDWVKDVAEKEVADITVASDEMDFLTEIVEEQGDEEIVLPEEEDLLEEAQMEEEEEAPWLTELQEEADEESEPASEESPDWLAESEAELTGETLEASFDEKAPEQIAEETPEEEMESSVWTAEDEPETPSWILAEEEAEESGIPVFEAEEPELEQEEAEEVLVPVMEVEEEPETAQELPVDVSEGLSQARRLLSSGDVTTATEHYDNLIKNRQNLDEVISDITDALDTRYPVDIGLWQTLGDAYVRKNSLQEALDAYTKAEELLR